MKKFVNSNKIFWLCLCFLVAIFIFFTLFFSFTGVFAATNSQDKLYGETLSSRDMSMSDCPNITAKYACLITKSGIPIYERNAYEPAKIASLTKILTAIVAIENFNISDTLEVSKKAVEVGESSAGLWVGDKLDMRSALYAMLVPSGNDSAQAICEAVGQKAIDNKDERIRKKSIEEQESEANEKNINFDDVEDVNIKDPEEAFVKLMNLKAKELNCCNANFTNPHGLADDEYASDDQFCCAMDIANITRYAMQNELFRSIVGGGDTTINVERNGSSTPIELVSTDILLENFEGCVGVKTGNTEIGGPCFSGAYKDIDGEEIYTIVLGSQDETLRFIDTQDLFNWYITNRTSIDLTDTGDTRSVEINGVDKNVGVVAYVAHSEWVDDAIPVTVKEEDKYVSILSIAGNAYFKLEPEEVSGSYKSGDKVGEIVITQHNKEVYRADLVSIYDHLAPNIFQSIGVAFDRLVRQISGKNTVAQSTILSNCDKVNENNKKIYIKEVK